MSAYYEGQGGLDELQAALSAFIRELESVRLELAALNARLEGIEARVYTRPPTPMEREVVVGGKVFRIRPLPPEAYIRLAGELPGLLFYYLVHGGEPSPPEEVAKRLYEAAKTYLAASLPPEAHEALEDMTFPEARDALAKIVETNGITDELKRFFRGRQDSGAPTGQGS